jgi:hypothetical protein
MHFKLNYVGCEVLTAMIMKNFVLWDIRPCSLLKVNDVSEESVVPIFRVEE